MHFKIRSIDHRDELLSKVITLGNKNSKTLGMFPEGAFLDHAKRKTIIVATDDGTLAGYILFRISQKRRFVSIAHLCIEPNYQGHGVPSLLLNEVKTKYQNILRGISLSCREDYKAASKLWERFGFKPMTVKRSRSKEEHYLTKWIYDFGNPDLFSYQEVNPDRVKAAIDSSIVIPMSEELTELNREAHSLKADWLEEEAEFLYAPEVFNDLNRDQDKTRAAQTRDFLKDYDALRFKPDDRDRMIKILEPIKSGSSPNDISDRKHLAECIVSGIRYFITLDKGILDLRDVLYEQFHLNVLTPTEFILLIDELTNSFDYLSFRLAGANYDSGKLKSDEIEKVIEAFSGINPKERQHDLKTLLINCATDPKKGIVRLIKDKQDDRIAFYALTVSEKILKVSLIRIKKSRISAVLFQQLIKDIISYAVKKCLSIILIEEKQLTDSDKTILISMGFEKGVDNWRKITISGIYSLRDIFSIHEVSTHFDGPSIISKIEGIEDGLKETLKLDLERKLWPAKISDISIPTYIIPIKPRWAGQLFDNYIANSNLFGAAEELSWSRENVYYRSVKPVSEKAPGRILWYLSSETNSPTGRNKGIVATSYLDEVHVNRVKAVFQKFKHFGVYEWRDVYQLAEGELMSDIKALKFSDTEVFRNIVSFEKVTEIMLLNNRPKNSFASPVEVSADIFNAIYKLGKNE